MIAFILGRTSIMLQGKCIYYRFIISNIRVLINEMVGSRIFKGDIVLAIAIV